MAVEVFIKQDCECVLLDNVPLQGKQIIDLLVLPRSAHVQKTTFNLGVKVDIIQCTQNCSIKTRNERR
jgi:hypothetical protein